MTRLVAAAAALAFVAGLMSLVVDGGGPGAGDGVRLVVPGGAQARIDGPAERRTVGPGRYRVDEGDTVTAVARAVLLEMGDGASIELREGLAGSDPLAPADTAVRVAPVPALLDGEALATASDGELALTVGGTVVRVSGAARLSRSLTFATAVYDGTAVLESAGREVAVDALRQAAVPGLGLVPGRPVPLVYDELDPWDQRHLGEAIDLTRVLDARSRGFTAQLDAGEATTPGFYAVLYTELEEEPVFAADVFRRTRPPGELLVGTAIALEGDDGDLADRLRSVFSFRDDGAEWGLVALDQEVGRGPLLARLDAAFDRSPLLFAGGPPASAPPGPPSPPGPGGPAPPPPPPPPPPPEPPLVPPVEDPVDDLLDLVGGLLPEEEDDDPGTGTPVDPLVGTLVDVVEGVVEPVGDAVDETTETLDSLAGALG